MHHFVRMALSFKVPAMPAKTPKPRKYIHRAHGALLQGAGHAGENTHTAQMHHIERMTLSCRSRPCRRKHPHRANASHRAHGARLRGAGHAGESTHTAQMHHIERMALSYKVPAMPAKTPTLRKCITSSV